MAQLFNTPENGLFKGIKSDLTLAKAQPQSEQSLSKAKKGTPEYEEWLRKYREKRGKKAEADPAAGEKAKAVLGSKDYDINKDKSLLFELINSADPNTFDPEIIDKVKNSGGTFEYSDSAYDEEDNYLDVSDFKCSLGNASASFDSTFNEWSIEGDGEDAKTLFSILDESDGRFDAATSRKFRNGRTY